MKIAIIGYGKMGREIEKVAHERGHETILKITRENTSELTADNLSKADVAIEFSTPSSAFENIIQCFEARIPVVSGTTGWGDKMEEAEKICREKEGCLFHASNFSLGVNILFSLNRWLAGVMDHFPQYRVNIYEVHHVHKKDAPSGTAIKLADDLKSKLKKVEGWTGKQEGSPSLVPIKSERKGEVPGTHIVSYKSVFDEIEISHRALGRKGFAEGAVAAGEFVKGKKGVYSMKDLLGLD